MRHTQRGFSLIELMIALVILGILVGVALPSYQQSVIRGHRSVAQADLLAAAQAVEKDYALFFTYANSAADVTFPSVSPRDAQAGDARYRLSLILNLEDRPFVIRATPIAGSQVDGQGIMEIDNLGRRFWDKNNDGDTNDAGEDNWDGPGPSPGHG